MSAFMLQLKIRTASTLQQCWGRGRESSSFVNDLDGEMGALSDEAKMQKRKNLKSPTDTEINSIVN